MSSNPPNELPPDAVVPWSVVHPGEPEPSHPFTAPPGGGWFYHPPTDPLVLAQAQARDHAKSKGGHKHGS